MDVSLFSPLGVLEFSRPYPVGGITPIIVALPALGAGNHYLRVATPEGVIGRSLRSAH